MNNGKRCLNNDNNGNRCLKMLFKRQLPPHQTERVNELHRKHTTLELISLVTMLATIIPYNSHYLPSQSWLSQKMGYFLEQLPNSPACATLTIGHIPNPWLVKKCVGAFFMKWSTCSFPTYLMAWHSPFLYE